MSEILKVRAIGESYRPLITDAIIAQIQNAKVADRLRFTQHKTDC